MGVKRFEDLVAWRLASRFAAEVYDVTRRGVFAEDMAFRDQLRSAADAIPANIAEGFGRYRPKDFASFLRIARSSAMEAETRLIETHRRGWITEPEFTDLRGLVQRSIGAMTRLHTYLKSCSPEGPRSNREP